MSLENTFRNVKKPAEEKKLEVITSKKAIIKDLRAYFEQNKYKGIIDWDGSKKYFSSYMNFLQNFKLSPEIISEFNKKIRSGDDDEEAFGIYLSALMQTSYNQDCNNFIFEDVNAGCFGALLKGQPKKPIKIAVKGKLEGKRNLFFAKNCLLTAKKLKGDMNLWWANGCLAEITNYQGEDFGHYMKNCTIKSENKDTLERIKEQTWKENNKFELK